MQPEPRQSILVDAAPPVVLDRAMDYLEAAGLVSTGLAGTLDRKGDRLVVHHGRMETRIEASEEGDATRVSIDRRGQAPLEATRRLLYLVGIGASLLAWAMAAFGSDFPPLVIGVTFFAGLLLAMTVLFAVDRSLERRSHGLVAGLAEALQGRPLFVLERELGALRRTSAVVNGLLFYCGGILVEGIVFLGLFQNGLGDATTASVMRNAFLLPLAPAGLFGAIYFFAAGRLHAGRLKLLHDRRPRGG